MRLLRTAAALVSLVLAGTLSGCASTEAKADRHLTYFAAIDAAYGMSVNDLRSVPGVTVNTFIADVECIDVCSSSAVVVDASAGKAGPASLPSLLNRLRAAKQITHPGPVQSPGATTPPPTDPDSDHRCSGGPSSLPCGIFELDGRQFFISVRAQPNGAYRASFE